VEPIDEAKYIDGRVWHYAGLDIKYIIPGRAPLFTDVVPRILKPSCRKLHHSY
jgi:hypothetical protein